MTEMQPVSLTDLIASAKAEDWNKIDGELVPKLKDVDGNVMAEEILGQITDPNPNVRDVLATSLTALNIKDQKILERAINVMVGMAIKDPEKFPAGRAVAFLLSHQNDESLRDEIDEGIKKFTTRPEIPEWKKDLLENISDLVKVLK